MEICCSFKSFAGGTFGYRYREDRRCISQVVPLRSCKKDISSHLRRSRNWSWSYFVASRHLRDAKRYTDDFTICPTRRSNIGTGVTADLDPPVWQSADNAEPLALGAVLNPSQLMCNHSSHNSHCTTSSQHSGIEQWQNKLVSQVCLLLNLVVFDYRGKGSLQTLN